MIIGITGTPGAGKGAIVDYLVSKKGFTHYSARDFFATRMEKEGIPINRDTMIEYANLLRKEHGSRFVFDSLYEEAKRQNRDAVIESIRAIGEAQSLLENNGILLSVDADPSVRYTRIYGRGSALDKVSEEDFLKQQEKEMHSDDPNNQNIAAVMSMADYTIMNDGSLEELHAKLDDFLKKVDDRVL